MSWQTFRTRVQDWLADDEAAVDIQDVDACADDDDFDLGNAGPRVLHINFTDPEDEPYYVDDDLRAAVKAARRALDERRAVTLG